jgi:hypothetical protein
LREDTRTARLPWSCPVRATSDSAASHRERAIRLGRAGSEN